jgi:hypothetical protein
VWVVEGSYSFGGAEVGVRSTSREFGRWLDRALAPYRSGEKFQPDYSIVIAEALDQSGLAKERYHILYKGTIAVIRTPDIQTLVRTLLSDLEMLLFPDRSDAIFAEMNVVSLDGKNALVPGVLVPFIGTLGRRRLGLTGLTLPAETAVAIEPGSGRVVPIKPMLEFTPGAIDLLAEVVPGDGAESRMVVREPTGVDALVSIGWGRDPLAAVSKGLGLYRLGSHLMNLELLGAAALEGVRPMVERARCYEMAVTKPAEMLDALIQVFQTV